MTPLLKPAPRPPSLFALLLAQWWRHLARWAAESMPRPVAWRPAPIPVRLQAPPAARRAARRAVDLR